MRAVIFDFDGTIGDSFKTAIEIAHALTHRSQLVMPEEVARLRQLTILQLARELKIPKWQWPFLLMRGRRLMAQRLGEVLPFPGVDKVVLSLYNDGYKLFIMSSNSEKTIAAFLARHDLATYFTRIYGKIGLLGKARALRRILDEQKLIARDAVYVGDEIRDIEAAKQLNMPCVAVGWGYNAPRLLAEHAPMVVVKSAEQLQRVLEEWGSEL